MTSESVLVTIATFITMLAISGVWGVYCYLQGRRKGQTDLIEALEAGGIIYIDGDGIIHSGRAKPLPPPKRKRNRKNNNDDRTPPSTPAV